MILTTSPQGLLAASNLLKSGLAFFRTGAVASSGVKTMEVFDKKVSVEVIGDGRSPVVFLPGLFGLNYDYNQQKAMVDKTSTTSVFWDLAEGHTRDYSKGKEFFLHDAHFTKELMTKLGFKKFNAVGWSNGGISGLLMAALYPEMVERLMVWGARSFNNRDDESLLKDNIKTSNWAKSLQLAMKAAGSIEELRKPWEAMVELHLDIYHKTASEYKADICQEALSKIKCPTVILHGEFDDFANTLHAYTLYNGILKSRVEVFDEAFHNLHQTHPEDFQLTLDAFVDEDVVDWVEYECA